MSQFHLETWLGKWPFTNLETAGTSLWETHKDQSCLNYLPGSKWQVTHEWSGHTATCVPQV
eukprot:12897411-Prorocentrum_lima.AAC.1